MKDANYQDRHVDSPVGITIVPGEGKNKKEIVVVNENELIQYALGIHKHTGPQLRMQRHYVLPSWGFGLVTQRKDRSDPIQNVGERPLASPYSWTDQELEAVEHDDYRILVSMPERGQVFRYLPDANIHDVFSARYRIKTYRGQDGLEKNDFIPTVLLSSPKEAYILIFSL